MAFLIRRKVDPKEAVQGVVDLIGREVEKVYDKAYLLIWQCVRRSKDVASYAQCIELNVPIGQEGEIVRTLAQRITLSAVKNAYGLSLDWRTFKELAAVGKLALEIIEKELEKMRRR